MAVAAHSLFGNQASNTAYHNLSPLAGSAGILISALGLYLLISPFYVLPAGTPQPADYVLILAMGPACAILLMHLKMLPYTYIFGFVFALTTLLVNLVNYGFEPHARFLYSSLYYIYNLTIFIFTAHLFTHFTQRALKVAYIAIVITILIQFGNVMLFPDAGTRVDSTLFNPNQFSYWSMLTMMMLVVLKRGHKLNMADYALIGILMYFEILSLSRAGMVSGAIVIMILPFLPQFSGSGRGILLVTCLAGGLYIALHPQLITSLPQRVDEINNVIKKMQEIGEDMDGLFVKRNYDRLLRFPQYIFLGAGEGAFWRFDPHKPNEIHSGLATLVFSYGILGTVTFFAFILGILNRQPWYMFVLVGAIMMYGLTHQHLRFSHFWMLLGMIYASPHFAGAYKQCYFNEKRIA